MNTFVIGDIHGSFKQFIDLLKKINYKQHEDKIILVGDYAKGIDSGLIEVFLIGQKLNMEYISQLEEKIEKLIGRKVSFYLLRVNLLANLLREVGLLL